MITYAFSSVEDIALPTCARDVCVCVCVCCVCVCVWCKDVEYVWSV